MPPPIKVTIDWGSPSAAGSCEQLIKDAAEQHLIQVMVDCASKAVVESCELAWHAGRGPKHDRALAAHRARVAAYTIAAQRAESAYKQMQIWMM